MRKKMPHHALLKAPGTVLYHAQSVKKPVQFR